MQAADRFPATRAEALERLAAFVPRAGRHYAENRNADLGPGSRSNVSLLSPYLRRRLITEHEVVKAVLARHSFAEAGKYLQEVLWRTYWKGWLEMRPAVWQRFVEERDAVRSSFADATALESARCGTTGIEGFDDWARELVATGYLHNHARMWFASIWIFTLRLPWTLGADFFLQYLIDADPASNTLSWRWVAGLQTIGKTYLATADNIARYSDGRFAPKGLATVATPLVEAPIPAPVALHRPADPDPDTPALLLVTSEDLNPETMFAPRVPFAGALVLADASAGSDRVRAFAAAAAIDTAQRVEACFGCPVGIVETLDPTKFLSAAHDANVGKIVTLFTPTGPVAELVRAASDALKAERINVIQIQRGWDSRFWPQAKKGFFAFKERIPALLEQEISS